MPKISSNGKQNRPRCRREQSVSRECRENVVQYLRWLVVLSRLPVSIAYPMASLGYFVAASLGVLFLREPIHVLQIVGIVVICLGGGVVARSAVC